MQKEDSGINRNTQMWIWRSMLMTENRNTHRHNFCWTLSWLCLFVFWWVAAHCCRTKGTVEGVEIIQHHTGILVPRLSTYCTFHYMPVQKRFDSFVYLCMYGAYESVECFFVHIPIKTGALPTPIPSNGELCLWTHTWIWKKHPQGVGLQQVLGELPSLQRTQQLLHLS